MIFDDFIYRSPIYFFDENHQEVNLTVKTTPIGKERPRAARRGKFIQIYTPRKTANYEKEIRKAYKKEYHDLVLSGPLEVDIMGFFEPPKHESKKKKQQMLKNEIAYTKKPDCDNMVKPVLDGLNKTAYDDDAQICKLKAEKRYGYTSKIDIHIKQL